MYLQENESLREREREKVCVCIYVRVYVCVCASIFNAQHMHVLVKLTAGVSNKLR